MTDIPTPQLQVPLSLLPSDLVTLFSPQQLKDGPKLTDMLDPRSFLRCCSNPMTCTNLDGLMPILWVLLTRLPKLWMTLLHKKLLTIYSRSLARNLVLI